LSIDPPEAESRHQGGEVKGDWLQRGIAQHHAVLELSQQSVWRLMQSETPHPHLAQTFKAERQAEGGLARGERECAAPVGRDLAERHGPGVGKDFRQRVAGHDSGIENAHERIPRHIAELGEVGVRVGFEFEAQKRSPVNPVNAD